MPYKPAWDLQLSLHEKVLAAQGQAGGERVDPAMAAGALMLVEHPPVITIGRRPDAQQHLLATPKLLALSGVEVSETDRGGDITFHGPGQLVAYPIIPLNRYNLNLHTYMRFLEEGVIRTLGTFNIQALRDPSSKPATGVWVRDPSATSVDGLAKICALGIKVRRWVTLHGIALNVTTDLSYFGMINACGLSRPVTSMHKLRAERCPDMAAVKATFIAQVELLLADLPVAAA